MLKVFRFHDTPPILRRLYHIKIVATEPPGVVIPNLEALNSSEILVKASTKWYLAAFSYVGFCMLWLAGFLASLGSRAKNLTEAKLGGILFSLAVVVGTLGLLSTIEVTAGTQIPMLFLANDIHPFFSSIFALIIITGIYSTAVPLLWNVTSRITEEKTTSFKLLTLLLAIVGFTVGIWLPFDKLVNIVYVINGYFGGILLIIMLYRSIKKSFTTAKNTPNPLETK